MTNRPVQNRPTLLDGSDAGGIGISALSVQVSGTPISKKTQRCGERVAGWATSGGPLPPCRGGSALALTALTPAPADHTTLDPARRPADFGVRLGLVWRLLWPPRFRVRVPINRAVYY